MKYASDKYGEVIKKDIINGNNSKGYTKFMEGDLIWSRITPCMQNKQTTRLFKEIVNNPSIK